MKVKYQLYFFTILLSVGFFGQSKTTFLDSLLIENAKRYQEISYAHLNKSIYLQGEQLGFTAYIFDKKTNLLSEKTKNVYVKILDKDHHVIKEQLVAVKNGVAQGSFLIDDTFTKNNYTFIVFTNWMLNFQKENIFRQSFKVLNVETNTIYKPENDTNQVLDIQLLPESGLFLNNVINTVGVVVKDTLGYGIPNLKGTILIDGKEAFKNLTLNHLGIGRFSILIDKGKTYKLLLYYKDKILAQSFATSIKEEGVLISSKEIQNSCYVSLKTNAKTLQKLSKTPLLLLMHNGTFSKKYQIQFKDKLTINKKIPLAQLSKGVNIFTLFNEEERPVSERLFFNHSKLKILKSNQLTTQVYDSLLNVSMVFNALKYVETFNNVSISILPKNTKSYTNQNVIIGQSLLTPFLKGVIENVGYYFKNITNKTKYELDNLLITQGWSSYNSMFFSNKKTEIKNEYLFENGLTVNFDIRKFEKVQKLFIHATKFNQSKFLDVYNNTKTINFSDYFPYNNEELNVSKVDYKGKLDKVSMDVTFYPSKIPSVKNINFKTLNAREYNVLENYTSINNFSKLNNSEMLNEIVVKANLEKVRRQKIRNESFGRVYFIDKNTNKQTLANFLNTRPGIAAIDDMTNAKLVVKNLRNDEFFRIVLNGLQVSDYLLFNYWMDAVEYVEIDTALPLFSTKIYKGGTINVKTKPNVFNTNNKTVSNFEIPLTFSRAKKFYAPKYTDKNTQFFRNYGVIDWLPINKIDTDGVLEFNIKANKMKSMILFLEGFTKNGDYIFEEQTINLN